MKRVANEIRVWSYVFCIPWENSCLIRWVCTFRLDSRHGPQWRFASWSYPKQTPLCAEAWKLDGSAFIWKASCWGGLVLHRSPLKKVRLDCWVCLVQRSMVFVQPRGELWNLSACILPGHVCGVEISKGTHLLQLVVGLSAQPLRDLMLFSLTAKKAPWKVLFGPKARSGSFGRQLEDKCPSGGAQRAGLLTRPQPPPCKLLGWWAQQLWQDKGVIG